MLDEHHSALVSDCLGIVDRTNSKQYLPFIFWHVVISFSVGDVDFSMHETLFVVASPMLDEWFL